jgi:hypothetical protein
VDGSGTAAAPPTLAPPRFAAPNAGDDNPRFESIRLTDETALDGTKLDELFLPAVKDPLDAAVATASELPLASEAAIVTVAGEPDVPAITKAPCTMWFAVRSLPAFTLVVPVPSIAPTCWFVPSTNSPALAELLFDTLTRAAGEEVEESAETEPAKSSVALPVTVASTPVPIVEAPEVMLNLSVPPVTANEALFPSESGPVRVAEPAPDLEIDAPAGRVILPLTV